MGKNSMSRALHAADIKINNEYDIALNTIYRGVALALMDDGWGLIRLNKLLDSCQTVFDDLGENDKSVVQMLDEETGVELMSVDNKKHWYEVTYLSEKRWQQYMEENKLNPAYLLAARAKMLKWCRPQVYATILLALNRYYGYKSEKIGKIYAKAAGYEEKYMFKWKSMEAELQKRKVKLINDTVKKSLVFVKA